MYLRALPALMSIFAISTALPTTRTSDQAVAILTVAPAGRGWPWPEGFHHYMGDLDMIETECGLFKFGNKNVADRLIIQLESYDPLINSTIPSRACRRQACQDSTAIYVCNHNYDIEPTRHNLSYQQHIAPWARKLLDACADWPVADGSVSGELTESWGFTVVVAEGNCSDDIDAGPEMIPFEHKYV